MSDKCNICGEHFEDAGGTAWRQSLKNRRYLATLDKNGDVLAECCEQCAQDIEDLGLNHL